MLLMEWWGVEGMVRIWYDVEGVVFATYSKDGGGVMVRNG